jgi:hypothetical protein
MSSGFEGIARFPQREVDQLAVAGLENSGIDETRLRAQRLAAAPRRLDQRLDRPDPECEATCGGRCADLRRDQRLSRNV